MYETRKEAAQDVTRNCEETQEVELSEKDLEKVAGGVNGGDGGDAGLFGKGGNGGAGR